MFFSVPVALSYKGRETVAAMGPFERSMERDFALTLNKKAINECSDVEKLREVAASLLEGWSNMQEAMTALVKENLELRQAMSLQNWDLEAASQLLDEASTIIENERNQQSSGAKWRLWPFGK
jgi:hypothetical protein